MSSKSVNRVLSNEYGKYKFKSFRLSYHMQCFNIQIAIRFQHAEIVGNCFFSSSFFVHYFKHSILYRSEYLLLIVVRYNQYIGNIGKMQISHKILNKVKRFVWMVFFYPLSMYPLYSPYNVHLQLFARVLSSIYLNFVFWYKMQ